MAISLKAALIVVEIYASIDTGDCNTSGFTATVTYEGIYDDTGSNQDWIGYIIYDGNGVPHISHWLTSNVGTSSTVITSIHNTRPVSSTSNSFTARPLTIVIYDTPSAPPDNSSIAAIHDFFVQYPVIDSLSYDPVDDIPDCAQYPLISSPTNITTSSSALFNDSRINPDAHAPFVIFNHNNTLILYTPQGALIGTAEVAACPQENTLLLESAGVQLYHLASCELQAIGSALDPSKTYTVRFTLNGTYHSFEG
jgi:hypothetical protein